MENENKPASPRFGLLLIVLISAVIFCMVLTWVMSTYFADF